MQQDTETTSIFRKMLRHLKGARTGLAVKPQLKSHVHKSHVVKIKPKWKRAQAKRMQAKTKTPFPLWTHVTTGALTLTGNPITWAHQLWINLKISQSQLPVHKHREKRFPLWITHQVRSIFINRRHFLLAHPLPFPRNRGAPMCLRANELGSKSEPFHSNLSYAACLQRTRQAVWQAAMPRKYTKAEPDPSEQTEHREHTITISKFNQMFGFGKVPKMLHHGSFLGTRLLH